MIDWNYLVSISVFPIIFLLFPAFYTIVRNKRFQRKFDLNKGWFIKFLTISFMLSFLIFIIFIYLTGGISTFYRLQEGLYFDSRVLVWNVTRHIRVYIPYDTGLNFLAVAILSGVVYGGLLTTKPYCEIIEIDKDISTNNSSKGSSAVSSISTSFAGVSAIASGVVCCSTSIVAFISPAFASILAPIAPWLILLSLLMLNVTFVRYVFPRFPTTRRNWAKNEIEED